MAVHFDTMSELVRAELNRYISFISEIEGVLRIYLFGSYAYGQPSENSDLDLYVIVRDEIDTLKIMQRISRGLYDRVLPMDVLVDRDSDFKALSMPDRVTLQREVKNKGELVYGQ